MYLISLMKKHPTLSVAALSTVLIFCAYFYGKSKAPNPEIRIEERIVEIVKEIEVEKERKEIEIITIIEEKPDGSKLTRIEEREKSESSKKVSKDSDKKSENIVHVEPRPVTKNRVGLGVYLNSELDYNYSMEYGRRMWDSPLWLKVEYIQSDRPMLGFGVSYEF